MLLIHIHNTRLAYFSFEWSKTSTLILIPGKGKALRVRRATQVELSRTTDALSRNLPIGQAEEEDEEDGMYVYCL